MRYGEVDRFECEVREALRRGPYAVIRKTTGIDPEYCCPNCLETTSTTQGGSWRCEPCGLNWRRHSDGTVFFLTPIDGPYNAPPSVDPTWSAEWARGVVAYERKIRG